MKLLIDAGNTRIKWCKVEGSTLSITQYLDNDTISSFKDVLAEKRASECLIASVKQSPMLTSIISLLEENRVPIRVLQAEPFLNGLVNSYAQPERMGVDRWLAMLGGKNLAQHQCFVVVSAGTATTLDIVDEAGKHLGGWIMPGLALMASSLFEQAEKVNGKFNVPLHLGLASDTANAVNHGALAATLGLIEQGLASVRSHDNSASQIANIYITGGNAKVISAHLAHKHVLDEQLLFKGMLQYC